MTVTGRALRVETVALRDVDDALVRAWRDLAAEAAEPNPFLEPEMLLPAARWLSGGNAVRLLTVRRDGRLALVMPITRERYRRIPLPAVTTWRHHYRYVGTPLVHPHDLDAAVDLAVGHLHASGADWLVLQQLYVDGPVARAFRRAVERSRGSWVEHGVWGRPAIRAREEETYLRETLTARSAKTLRRLRRNLERDVGPVVSRDVVRAGGDALDEAVEGFLELEGAGWKGRAGTAMVATKEHAEFFRETCRAFAAAGRLELWQLEAGDVAAVRQCHVRAGDTVFQWRSAYDEDLAQYSPGVQLDLDLVHAFHLDPELTWVDPCTADVPGTPRRLFPDRRRFGDVLVGFTPVGRSMTRVFPLAALLRAWAIRQRRRIADRGRT